MALRNELNAHLVSRRLCAWLPSVLDGVGAVEVTDVEMPSSSGLSSETVLVDVCWERDGTTESAGLVVRVPPERGGVFHTYDIGREARIMSLVARHTDAPVPRVLAHESTGKVLGREFLLIERVYGQVASDDPPYVAGGWVVDLTPAQRATMFDEALRALASVHQLDPLAVGLGDLLRPELGDTVIAQDLEYWRRFYIWAAAGRSVPTIERAFEILTPRRPTDDAPVVVSWGDARFGNLMFGPDQKVTGIFDWEMATLGRPEVDLGFFLFCDRMYSSGMGLPRLEGYPSREEAVDRYQTLSGHPVREFDWWEAYAGLRGAILLMRVATKLVELGMVPDDSPMPVNNPASQALAEILDLPAPTGDVGWIAGRG